MVKCGIDQTIVLNLLTVRRMMSLLCSDSIPVPLILYQDFTTVQHFLYLVEPVQLMAFIGPCCALNYSRHTAECPEGWFPNANPHHRHSLDNFHSAHIVFGLDQGLEKQVGHFP